MKIIRGNKNKAYDSSGFDLLDADSLGTLSVNGNTVTLSPGIGPIRYFIDACEYQVLDSKSITLPDTIGKIYFLYFDTNAQVHYVELVDDLDYYNLFQHYAPYALAMVASDKVRVQPEWHGYRMGITDHLTEHLSIGTRYERGIDPVGFAENSDTYTAIEGGIIHDEDIRHEIDLSSQHRFLYRSGPQGIWTWTDPSNKAGYEGKWNHYVNGEWVLEESTADTDFWIITVVAFPWINDIQVTKLIGQSAYKNVRAARDAIESEAVRIAKDGLPSNEFFWLYAYIVNKNDKVKTLDGTNIFFDWRYARGGAGGNKNDNTSVALTPPWYIADASGASFAIDWDATKQCQCLGTLGTVDITKGAWPTGTYAEVLLDITLQSSSVTWSIVDTWLTAAPSSDGRYIVKLLQDKDGNILGIVL